MRDDVLDQVTDIAVRVLGCSPDSVVPGATFKALGSDSLTIVEIGEELGRRFGLYLSDDTIDSMRTVQDAVDAVADAPRTAVAVAAPARERVELSSPSPVVKPHIKRKALTFATWMAVVGVLIGGFIGFGLSAVVSASGIDDVNLPPISGATSEPTPTETTPTPTPTPVRTDDPTPDPTLFAEKDRVAPGERFILSGAFPELDEGVELQVQVREDGTGWDNFPITTQTRAGGKFRTELYTSRTGDREFRVTDEATDKSTPVVKVAIG